MGRKESGLKSPSEISLLMAPFANAGWGLMSSVVERARMGVVLVRDDDNVVVGQQSFSPIMSPTFESYAFHPTWLQWNGSNTATGEDES